MSVNVGSNLPDGAFRHPGNDPPGRRRHRDVASVQGFACHQNVAAYATTKGAIHTLSGRLGPRPRGSGIRVNSVSPGSIRTPILEKAARGDNGTDADVEEAYKRFGEAHPSGASANRRKWRNSSPSCVRRRPASAPSTNYKIDGGLTAGLWREVEA